MITINIINNKVYKRNNTLHNVNIFYVQEFIISLQFYIVVPILRPLVKWLDK